MDTAHPLSPLPYMSRKTKRLLRSTVTKASTAIMIRSATHEDVSDIVRIDTSTYIKPWSSRKFHTVLENNNETVVMVAGYKDQGIVAYAIYDLLENTIGIRRMAAYPESTGGLVDIVTWLKRLLTGERRSGIVMYVPESHLATQVMLREQGFRADRNSIMRNFFPDSDEDAYILQYRLGTLAITRSTNDDNTAESICATEDAPWAGE